MTIFTTQSQIMRKLNPMKRPRMPPQSATSEMKGKASSSLWTSTMLLENIGWYIVVVFSIGVKSGSSLTYIHQKVRVWVCKREFLSIKLKDYKTMSTATYFIFHEWTWHQTFCFLHYIFPYHSTNSFKFTGKFCQQGKIVTERQTRNTDFSPRWLTAYLDHDAFVNTVSKIIDRGFFTWIIWSIE